MDTAELRVEPGAPDEDVGAAGLGPEARAEGGDAAAEARPSARDGHALRRDALPGPAQRARLEQGTQVVSAHWQVLIHSPARTHIHTGTHTHTHTLTRTHTRIHSPAHTRTHTHTSRASNPWVIQGLAHGLETMIFAHATFSTSTHLIPFQLCTHLVSFIVGVSE